MKIALVGNPNCGKTTLFNSLTGSSQYVGNWPGVTVEKKEGKLKGHKDVIITDLPGIYSLSPYTLEEVVSREYLLNEKVDAIINLVDATNIERNLYLTTQVMELGIPVVMALNMMDLVEKKGDSIDVKKLSESLGVTIVPISALKSKGIDELISEAVKKANSNSKVEVKQIFSNNLENVISGIEGTLPSTVQDFQKRFYSIKLFERDEKIIEKLKISKNQQDDLETIIKGYESSEDDDSESIIINERYEYIAKAIDSAISKKKEKESVSDKIDKVVTNRVLALPIFAVIMIIVYYISVTSLGSIVTDWTNDTLFGDTIQPAVTTFLEHVHASDWLIGLIVDGAIGGVGAVLGFVPQMLILFFFLSILEDSGYMARVAFIMDRLFRKFGLSGKSFIPMLIGSGCGVPGVMASKTIENENDRRMTIMTTTFIPCGAKLPVIALIGGAMFSDFKWMAPCMYFVGVIAVIVSGIILKKTKRFAGDPAPFVMELPDYHIPAAKGVLIHMWERGKSFIKKAGTVIFIACALIWFLSSFGFDHGFGMVDESKSLLANIGNVVAPIFKPLGFGNWKATVATVSGLVAKENVVGTFGVLLGLGADAAESDPGLLKAIAELFPYGAAAMSFLIFNLLCAPCFAAIGAIKREMSNTKWTFFAIGYQTVLAYCTALVVNQIGGLVTGALSFGVGTVVAIIIIIAFLYLLFRKGYKAEA